METKLIDKAKTWACDCGHGRWEMILFWMNKLHIWTSTITDDTSPGVDTVGKLWHELRRTIGIRDNVDISRHNYLYNQKTFHNTISKIRTFLSNLFQ